MGSAGGKGDFQIGDRCADSHAQVLLFGQMGQDQALPVPVQAVLAAFGGADQAASPGKRFQDQVDLGVVAQRLKVSDALHRLRDGLLVEHPSPIDFHRQLIALQNQAFQDLCLDLSHQLHLQLLQAGIPAQTQHRVLVLQLPQLWQDRAGIGSGREHDPIAHDGFEDRRRRRGFGSETHAVFGCGQSHRSADLTLVRFVHRGVFLPLIAAELGDLLLPVPAAQRVPHPENAACDLHVGQTAALCVVGDLEDPRSEGVRPVARQQQPGQSLHKGVHAKEPESGAKKAGENIPGGDQLAHALRADPAGGEVFLHAVLAAEGQLFVPPVIVR